MNPNRDLQLDAFAVDVRELLSTTVASLYSHLITRPTGRAVRMAIEAQLQEMSGPAISQVDFSSVAILDYSCADEVVAKLLLAIRDDGPVRSDVFVYFRGLRSFHLEPVEAVLERHGLHAVVESAPLRAELVGSVAPPVGSLWTAVEEAGRIPGGELDEWMAAGERSASDLEFLLASRSLFRHPFRGDIYALSELSRLLAEPGKASEDHTDDPSTTERDETP